MAERRTLRERIAAGERLAGTTLTLPGAPLVELLAEPFDLVWIDLEHAPLGVRDAQEMIVGAQAAGTAALVRLPAAHRRETVTALDAGVDGVVFADIPDAAALVAAIEPLSHPPAGTRGWGPRRLSTRGRNVAGAKTTAPVVWAQVESRDAVDRAAEIAAVPGLDAICIGLADLSVSLGAPLKLDAPELAQAVAKVRDACREAGTAFALAGPLDTAPPELLAGATILVHSTDAKLCAQAVDAAAAWIRTTLEPDQERSTA